MPPHLVVAARVARFPDLLEQAHRAEVRIPGQAGLDDLLVGIEPGRPGPPRSVPDPLLVQIPVQLSRRDPAMHRPPADPGQPRHRSLAEPLFQIVPQKHPRLSSDHGVSSVRWRRHGKQTVRDPSESQPPTAQPLHGRSSNVGHFTCRLQGNFTYRVTATPPGSFPSSTPPGPDSLGWASQPATPASPALPRGGAPPPHWRRRPGQEGHLGQHRTEETLGRSPRS